MKLRDFASELSLKTYWADEKHLDADVATVYCGDLLSDVMAHVPQGAAWFTVLAHMNIIAVARLRDVTCIVIVNGSEPDKLTLDKARDQNIALFGSIENSAPLCMKIGEKLKT